MTVVNPKSISGITSITTASGSDDLLTIHNNSGAERFRVDGSGNTRITSGIVTTLSVGAITGDISIDDKIIHTGDTNTALRFPSADTFSVETAGQQNVQVNGTRTLLTSPSGTDTTVRLQHQGNSGYGDIILDRTKNAFLIDNDPSNAASDATYFAVKTIGSERLRINATGNMGLGVSDPNVLNEAAKFQELTLGGKTEGAAITLKDDNGNVQGGLFTSDVTAAMMIRTITNHEMRFRTNNTDRIAISSSGALLVGVMTPTYNSGDMQHEIKKNNSRTYTAPLMSAHSHLLLNNSDTTTNAFCGLGIRAGSADGAIGYVYTGSANSADFVINTDGGSNGVERFRITNDGKILIGTTTGSSDPWGYGAHFQLNGDSSGGESTLSLARHSADTGAPVIVFGKSRATGQADVTVVQDGDTLGSIHFTGADGSNWEPAASIMAYVDGTPASSGDGTDMPGRLCFYTTADGSDTASERLRITSTGDLKFSSSSRASNHNSICCSSGNSIDINGTEYLYFRTANSERFRVKSDGTLLHGITGTNYNTTAGIILSSYTDGASNVTPGTIVCSTTDIPLITNHSDSTDGIAAVWRKGGSSKGNVSISGDTTTYNTSSDYRLKENNVAISDGITRVKLLKPYRFNWKSNPSKTVDGFFAHEVTPAVPEAVQGEKDATPGECGMGYQSMDHAKLVPLLTAALQEEISKREALETRIAALESA